MADLTTLQSDFNQFNSDVSAALARAQASINALMATGLTPAQQAIVDSIDASVKTADATVNAFDVPAGTSTGTSTSTSS